MNVRFFALFAGVFCITLAVITQGVLPFVEPSSRTTRVTSVVRTDFGQLKWMVSEATDYTEQQLRGRNIYLREGCWYCHSQFVRPVTGRMAPGALLQSADAGAGLDNGAVSWPLPRARCSRPYR